MSDLRQDRCWVMDNIFIIKAQDNVDRRLASNHITCALWQLMSSQTINTASLPSPTPSVSHQLKGFALTCSCRQDPRSLGPLLWFSVCISLFIDTRVHTRAHTYAHICSCTHVHTQMYCKHAKCLLDCTLNIQV